MNTNFYLLNEEGNTTNNLIMAGETINKVFIYGNGEVLAELETIERHELTTTETGETKVNSVYNGNIPSIYLHHDIKKALKLNLNRNDNFYIKNSEKRWSFEPAYNLYINVNEVSFRCLGDVLAMETKDEKNYLLTYEIVFPVITITNHIIEREYCENYTLKENERFSSCYGSKNNPCIDTFEIKEGSRFSKLKAGKGILRKWAELETLVNSPVVLTKRCYTKMIESENRKNLRKIADTMNSVYHDRKFSYYDVEKLLQVVNISII